ncbi:hypothetical protein SD80_012800 [Scytonema tolypothrichoides VB-61278]|nr:hypothetical protein SD80_012800 [Scytonema tolypothrichoides VB-61278]
MMSDALNSACDACGLPLEAEDVLGKEYYAFGPFVEACRMCAESFFVGQPYSLRKQARLKAFARIHPDYLVAVVVAGLRRLSWSIQDAEHYLAIDGLQLLQISLYPRAIIDDWRLGPSVIAVSLPCRQEELRLLLAAGLAELAETSNIDEKERA